MTDLEQMGKRAVETKYLVQAMSAQEKDQVLLKAVELLLDQAEQEQIAESSDSSETPSAQKAEVKYRGIADQDKGKRLFIRKSPSTEGEVLGVLWTGQSGEIIDIGDEWVLLKYGDIEGYVFKEFLIIEELPQSADPQGL